ncbi:MAG: DUF4838 domain-containing protein, partial [Kiritimatiellia bacterium]|nr:DUF4838 domain-containing protein [Lentisphaerota bacterium]
VQPAAFIVQDGQSKGQIVIAENSTRMQKLAATELQQYIRKITGAELPVVTAPGDTLPVKIYVGQSAYTDAMGLASDDLDYGAYRMAAGPDYLVLLGRDRDYFQEKPGDGGAEYPAGRGQRGPAAEAWREKHGDQWSTPFSSSFKGYHKELGVWSIDEHGSLNAVNDFLRSLGVRWYMPGEFGEVLPELTDITIPAGNRTVRPDWGQRHMMFYYNAPFMASTDEFMWQLRLGFYPDNSIFGGHGTVNLLAPAAVKQKHPEFYALYGDARATGGQGKACYSSEGLLESAIGFSKLMFDEYDKDIVSLMPTDGYVAFCQCALCKGKDTPERGFKGVMSDYVWDFMNRAADEVAKTHPDKQILCYAYNTYLLPPANIETLHPNLQVGICHHRDAFHDPEAKQRWLDIRDGFLSKLPAGKIRMWEYYKVLGGRPGYYPRIIAEDLMALKGKMNGTMIEVSRGRYPHGYTGPDLELASNHLNLWLTARLWWDPDPAGLWWTSARNVDDILADYYVKFYGPVAAEMQAFIEYSEQNWPLMHRKPEPIDRAFELIAQARQAAGEDNIYAERVQLLIDYMEPLKIVREQLKVGRKDNPVATFVERNSSNLKLDGKLDDAFWKDLENYELLDVVNGEEVENKTYFKVAWAGDSLYLGIRCEEQSMEKLNVPARSDGDNTIFNGDTIELLLETPTHAYYQIAIDPEGHVNDLDRPGSSLIGKTGKYETKWEAGIEVAAYRGEDFWSLEIRAPALGSHQEDILPYFGISGDKPSVDAPWYFNVGRVRRAGAETPQVSAFSPTGKGGLHYMKAFARLQPE